MIGGREGRNLRFQRFALGGLMSYWLGLLIGITAAHWIFWCVFALTLVIEVVQEVKSR